LAILESELSKTTPIVVDAPGEADRRDARLPPLVAPYPKYPIAMSSYILDHQRRIELLSDRASKGLDLWTGAPCNPERHRTALTDEILQVVGTSMLPLDVIRLRLGVRHNWHLNKVLDAMVKSGALVKSSRGYCVSSS
jgi:hypothetical protein